MSSVKNYSLSVLHELELLESDAESTDISKAFGIVLETGNQGQRAVLNVVEELKNQIASVFPWFVSEMPMLYHRIHPLNDRYSHLIDLVAGQVLSRGEIVDRPNSQTQVLTLMAPGEVGPAYEKLAGKINAQSSKFAFMFSSLDTKATIGSFFQKPYEAQNTWSEVSKEKRVEVEKIINQSSTDIESILNAMDREFVEIATPRMIALNVKAVDYCRVNESSYVQLTTVEDKSEPRFRIDLGLRDIPVSTAIESAIAILYRYSFNVRRIIANEVKIGTDQFTVLQLVASYDKDEPIDRDLINWRRALKSLKTLSYVDHGDEFAVLMQGKNANSINETNLIRALANWSHIFLTKVNPYYYPLDRCARVLIRNEAFRTEALMYFRTRFDPRFKADRDIAPAESAKRLEAILADVTDEVERSVLKEGFNMLKNILKTNYFMVSKGALSFRIDPKVLNKTYYTENPFGIFFMIGRNFRAFQVRYRDIARGGVRVVMPRTAADYDHALAGVFDEVNGLSYAQQLKNKDIPEGGSKCVFVLKPGGNRHHAVKIGVSGLLDLIVTNSKTNTLADDIIDYYGKEEIIYLGPDENMTDDLIVWIIKNAIKRQYKYAWAFMSSKPDFGINHKTYGVTSEGLNVYLDNVLRYLKLDTAPSFRIKMTGGPDGDVAGNELKILHREYGERARVVSIADGFGAAFDPNGLDWKELLRLVDESLPVSDFKASALSKETNAFVIKADSPENMKIRDNLYATVEAEIFIPAGGRPYTVKDNNWQKFLKPDGSPSALAIVEGANIFFTTEARKKLVESGVVVIKDSSANKAGVICSSFEIIACLTISADEFAKIKPTYVTQVVETLRQKADNEAKLLFTEWRKRGAETNLVSLSYEISAEINQAKDIMRERLDALSDRELENDRYTSILYRHCPSILVEEYRERIVERLPRAHKIAIMSAYMASHLIYKEGLRWLGTMDPDKVFKIALEYMQAERTVEQMIVDVSASQLNNKESIIAILRGAGAKHIAVN